MPIYGVYDFTNRLGTWHKDVVKRFFAPWVVQQPFDTNPQAFADYSPLDQVRADAPPMFVVHGSIDTLAPVEDCREFVRRLREVSTQPVLYAEMAGAQHAFEIFPSYRSARVYEGIERFLHAIRTGRRSEAALTDELVDG